MRRLLVARAPYWDAERKALVEVPARVGVFRWSWSGELPDLALDPVMGNTLHFVTVVVRTTAALDREGAAGLQDGWPVATPTARDFVPHKPSADLLLAGAASKGTIHLRVGKIGKIAEVFDGADLASGTRTASGTAARTSGDPDLGRAADGVRVVAGEWNRNQEAADVMRVPWPRGDETVSVTTSDGRALSAPLPARVPYARLVSRTEAPDRLVDMCLDTLEIDVTSGRVDLTYRGVGALQRPDGLDLDRVDVMWWPADEPFVFAVAEAEIPRATVEIAWELEDIERGEPPPVLAGDELAAARYETWDVEHGPLPVMPVERYAKIAAELAEQREARERTLTRLAVDPYTWDVEERAWSQMLADPEVRDDDDERPTLAAIYGEAFRVAQDALARPEEADRTARDFARVTAAMEVDEPARALVEERVTLGEYQRLERRMRARADKEPDFAVELARLLDEERRRARTARRERRNGKDEDPEEEEDEDS